MARNPTGPEGGSFMAQRQDIDRILRSWKFEPGEVVARLVRAGDGREVLQMRIDLGLLQLEVEHRPDGTRPGGAETYFDHLLAISLHEGKDFTLDEEQCAEADRELVQYYQRRIGWLSLREFRRAARDAEHSLTFMDFLRTCSPSEEWTLSHEQYRPFILFHRAQAIALAELDETGPEAAIEAINKGLEQLRQFFVDVEAEERFDDDELVARLNELRESVRDHFHLGRTLSEQLADAVESEEFELAAKLRDEIARRGAGRL